MTYTFVPNEVLDENNEDNGTMPKNVQKLSEQIVGQRIISAEVGRLKTDRWPYENEGLILTLSSGKQVAIKNNEDCCAYTDLKAFLLHPESVDHVITGIRTEGKYTVWHIYADFGDVLTLNVGWSCGNPFYYGYGFEIFVIPDVIEGEVVERAKAIEGTS